MKGAVFAHAGCRQVGEGVFCVILALLTGFPPGIGEEIPVVASIENAEPEVLEVDTLDEIFDSTDYVDPGSIFYLDIAIRDNNTLSDIISIRTIIFSPKVNAGDTDSEEDHYTFIWDSNGFNDEGGVGSIEVSKCQIPSDMMLGEGTWRFALRFSKTARKSTGWIVLVRVEDEANTTELSTTFEVTSFVSLVINASQITFSGSPGQTVESDQNAISLICTSNHQVTLGCSCTEFTGVQDPNIVIQPTSFIFDDDPDPLESEETGEPEVTLSPERQDVFTSLPTGIQARNVYIFVIIPEPFLDQDYIGALTFELYS